MTRNHRLFPLSPARTSLALGACVFAAACMGAPLTNTPINTGTDSTTAARKALEGTWRLVSLEVANADGKKTTVQAEGELVLDAFANLKIIYRVAEAGLKALESVGVSAERTSEMQVRFRTVESRTDSAIVSRLQAFDRSIEKAEQAILLRQLEAFMTPDEVWMFRQKAHGFSHAEIAKARGCSVNAVDQKMSRLIRKIRALAGVKE